MAAMESASEDPRTPGSARPPLSRQLRIGSVDSGSVMNKVNYPLRSAGGSEHRMHLRSTSVDMNRPPPLMRSNSNAAWKHLNDSLNHLFPKKSSLPCLPKSPLSSRRPDLVKSSSRTSLFCDGDLDSEDDQLYHTVHATGSGRKNTLTCSRNSEPFSKIMRRRNGDVEDPRLSNASSMQSLHDLETPTPRRDSRSPYPWAAASEAAVGRNLANGVSPHLGLTQYCACLLEDSLMTDVVSYRTDWRFCTQT